MSEALLHTIWKFKLYDAKPLIGSKHELIEIVNIGHHNQDSGPDFFSSKLNINGIVLVGNVELHVKTSDWLKHNHQQNKAYNNLILHVVYEHDVEIPQNTQFNVSVLELKNYISQHLLNQYQSIQFSKNVIPCGKSITTVNELIWKSWLDRLAVSRIERKTEYIEHLFQFTKQHYEETLYILLCKNFGFKINDVAFELLGKSLPYSILKKYADNPIQIEALLFGVAGFLDELFEDDYPKLLQNEFEFLKQKHHLQSLKKEIWKFSKTRPTNFPTIRLSQLASIVSKQQSLYHLIEQKANTSEFKNYLSVSTSAYWETHFKFDTTTSSSKKMLGDLAFNSIMINTVVPFLFFTSQHQANESLMEYGLELLSQLPAEVNTKTKHYTVLGIKTDNALESQAQIELYDYFCTKHNCLQCNVGQNLLKGNL